MCVESGEPAASAAEAERAMSSLESEAGEDAILVVVRSVYQKGTGFRIEGL